MRRGLYPLAPIRQSVQTRNPPDVKDARVNGNTMTDPESLGLRGYALMGARALKAAHPSVVFTSGKRNATDQARAMAANVALNRQWIAQTYKISVARHACQQWVNAHPGTTRAQIEAGLLGVFATLPDAELLKLSRHLTGDAFDVEPVPNGDAIKSCIRDLPGLDCFLEREGGLTRWHAQFHPPAMPSRTLEA